MREPRSRSPEHIQERRQGIEERKRQLAKAISEALQHETGRHNAAVKNMHRLRALRLERDQKAKLKESSK